MRVKTIKWSLAANHLQRNKDYAWKLLIRCDQDLIIVGELGFDFSQYC